MAAPALTPMPVIKKAYLHRLEAKVVLALCGAVALMALVAALAGYPQASTDDLFFFGPALGLVTTGRLTNVFADSGTPFYSYTPYYPYLLGTWMWVWGISAASVVALQVVMMGIYAASAALVVARFSRNYVASLLVGALAFAGLKTLGIRPDSTAFAALGLGLALGCSNRGPIRAAGYTMLMAATAVAPAMLSYSVAALLFCLLTGRDRVVWRTELLGIAFGILVNAIIFSALIEFDYAGFIAGFRKHMELTGHGQGKQYTTVLLSLFSYWIGLATNGPLLVCSLVMLAWLWWQKRPLSYVAWTSASCAYAAVILSVFLNSSSSTHWILVFLWTAAAILITTSQAPVLLRGAVTLVLVGAYLLQSSASILSAIHSSPPDRATAAQIQSVIHRIAPTTLYIDCVAARYVYDYSLPAGMKPWENFGRPFGEEVSSASNASSGAVAVVSTRQLNAYAPFKQFEFRYRPLVIGGRTLKSIPGDPYRMHVFWTPASPQTQQARVWSE